jgi:hypothetical protein
VDGFWDELAEGKKKEVLVRVVVEVGIWREQKESRR